MTNSSTLPHHIWKTMSRTDLRQFAAAVFFLFAAIGPLSLLMDSSFIQGSWLHLLVMTIACGLFSWSIVMSFHRPLRLVGAIVLFNAFIFSLPLLQPEFLQPDVPAVRIAAGEPAVFSEAQLQDTEVKRALFGMTAVVCIAVGYALFVRALAKENKRRAEMETDVRLAKTIHDALLPKEPLVREWYDAAGMSVPAAQIGGDFFDLIPLSEDRLLAVVADASGHGTGAGILSAMTKSGILQEVRHTQHPAEVLRGVNATIHALTRKSSFVTCAAVLFDRAAKTATVVTAGHPPLLVCHADGSTEKVRTHNLALGIAPHTTFSATEVPMRSGDLFCFITDGLTESVSAAQEQFGIDRIAALLPGRSSDPSTGTCAALIGAVSAFSGANIPADDITTLVVTVR